MSKQRRVILATAVVAVFLLLVVGIGVVASRMTRSSDGRLVKVADPAAAVPVGAAAPASWGRIVVCSMAGFTETPAELQAATEGKFVPRAIAWAARRPVP